MTEADTSHRIGPETEPDRYRLVRSIGRGGEALLYLAELELAGETEPVVLKIFDTAATVTEEQFTRIGRRWKEQAELLRFVHRPGVVGVREYFEAQPVHRSGEVAAVSGRALVLVLNYVDGLDLRDWRAGHDFASAQDWREVASVLAQLAETLDFLHSGLATPSRRLVVHGDLSPGNVMVDDRGRTTLVDFGLSKLTAEGSTAQVWFTPGYAAPEVFEGKRTPATDRYAFGGIAYFLLSGQAPPIAPDQLAQALGGLPQFAALPADTRARLCAIAAADPDRRPGELSSWVAELRRAVELTPSSEQGTLRAVPSAAGPYGELAVSPYGPPPSAFSAGPYQPVPGPPPAGSRGPRRAMVAFAVLAAVIVVSLVAYLATNRGSGGGSAKDGDTPTAGSAGTGPTTAPLTTGPESMSLTDETPSTRDPGGSFVSHDATLLGTYYEHALVLDDGPDVRCQGSITYDLGGQWKSLGMVVGIDDDSKDIASKVTLKLDGKVIDQPFEVDRDYSPVTLKLDVTGGHTLAISFADTMPHCQMGDLVLANPTLTR